MTVRPSSAAGREIRYWRSQRALSQLDLALRIGMAPRQLSFIETGRARPRQDTLLRLAEVLSIPLRDRNTLLLAAGFPPLYPEPALSKAELAPVRHAVEHLLHAHEPYPAWVTNRCWDILAVNEAAKRLFTRFYEPGINLIEVVFQSAAWREMVENWIDVAWHSLEYLRHEVRGSSVDDRISQLADLAEQSLRDMHPPDALKGGSSAVYPRFKIDGKTLETLAVVARFGTARDITVAELRIQMLYPADDVAEEYFRRSGSNQTDPV